MKKDRGRHSGFWTNKKGLLSGWTRCLRTTPEFQGLLEDDKEVAPYPDISAELPGVESDDKEREFQMVSEKLEPDF